MSNLTVNWFNILVVLIIANLVFTFQVVSRQAPNGKPQQNAHNRNQQLLRHKIGPPHSATNQPEEKEDLKHFCTLANFQNCISELWPGTGPASSPSDNAQGKPQQTTNNAKEHNQYRNDNLETTTFASVPLSNDLAFPTTHRELQATCSDLKERVRCLDRHSERCFTPEMLQVFGHIVTNAKQFVHDLCDNKRVQSGKYFILNINSTNNCFQINFNSTRIFDSCQMFSKHIVG